MVFRGRVLEVEELRGIIPLLFLEIGDTRSTNYVLEQGVHLTQNITGIS